MDAQEIRLQDLETLIRSQSPELADTIITFVEQADHYPPAAAPGGGAPTSAAVTAKEADDGDDAAAADFADAVESARAGASSADDDDDDEDDDEDEDDEEASSARPPGAMSVEDLRRSLSQAGSRWSSRAQRQQKAREAWHRFLNQPDSGPPTRFALAELLVRLYEDGGEHARATLLTLAERAPLRFGLWGGLKRVYKLAEEDLDAEIFGALAARFDREANTHSRSREVGLGTLIYLQRRAWRFLKALGQQLPAVYPQVAAQVLRRYPGGTSFNGLWVANHIWVQGRRGFAGHTFHGSVPADLVKSRAFDDAWKRASDTLMMLLEQAQADAPARFAIQSLRRDAPERLRSTDPAWLARLSARPLDSVHEFVVELLQTVPELHQSKLRALGLHDTALGFLRSSSQKARAFAIEYARAHGQDLADERLLALLDDEDTAKEVRAFAAGQLKARAPRTLGLRVLGRLLAHDETKAFAAKALGESFERAELPETFFIDMIFGESAQRGWAASYLKDHFQQSELGAPFWRKVVDDKRAEDWEHSDAVSLAVSALDKVPVAQLGAEWLLDGLAKDHLNDHVERWLRKADSLPDLPLERVKGLIFNRSQRDVAIAILQNTKLVKPRTIGLGWLLALARRADPTLHEFAHRYLLQHMKPDDFAAEGSTAVAGGESPGVARLFGLALGEKEPEAVRAFAQTYLRCHHPTLGPEQPESRAMQLKPQLPRTAYTAERLWPALHDVRPDVRKLAVLITRAELRRWGYHTRVYELAESEHKEVRNIAVDALLKAGEAGADLACTLKLDEIDPARVFALTESRRRGTRDTGMELIRRHYARVGGAERLAWLLDSPDRDIRLFAVRLLWENHRPTHLPPGWTPKKATVAGEQPKASTWERFPDVEALRAFLRRVLYGLPPGRSMEPSEEAARRRLPASVAKRNVIEIVRDLGVEDEAFARLIAPVLSEFTGSLARSEWQACLAALMTLQVTHPGLLASPPATAAHSLEQRTDASVK